MGIPGKPTIKTYHGYFLAGPTASGKSAVAEQLADTLQTGILCADSMQVYRGLDIGTAKPSAASRAHIPHFGLDLVEPWDSYSTGRYLDDVSKEIRRQADPDRPLVVCGGTGLYLRALLQGLDNEDSADPGLRHGLEALQASEGVEGLRERLIQVDPARLESLSDPANPRRLIRAIEQAASGADPRSWDAPLPGPIPALCPDREVLQERIRLRVAAMFEQGLLNEVKQLMASSQTFSATAAQAIGYREAAELLSGQCTSEQAQERTVVRTRQYAKRQMTWLRNQVEVCWIQPGGDYRVDELADCVYTHWKAHGPFVLKI